MEAADVEGGLGKKGGVLTALHRKLMNDHGISPQQYWNGTLTGNHCRKYLQCHREILGKLRDAIETTHAKATGDLFFARFSSVLKELDVIGHYARATRFLTDAELDALEASCTAFGVASRATFGKMLTCKGHLIEKHLPRTARRFRTIGIFGEDGLEALHPLDTKSRVTARAMRNPVARHKAVTAQNSIQTDYRGPDLACGYKRKRKAGVTAAAADISSAVAGAAIDADDI